MFGGGLYIMKKSLDLILHPFKVWMLEQGKSIGTAKTYNGVIENLLIFSHKTNTTIEEISDETIQTYLASLEDENKSISTIQKHLAAINVFARYIEKPHITSNVKQMNKEKLEPFSYLNEDDLEKLTREIEVDGNLRNIAIFYLLLHTGIRVSELCNLNKTDLILEENKCSILIRGVDLSSSRVIPLSSLAKKHLVSYLDKRKSGNEFIFISSVNRPITTRAVQYMLKKYNVNPHLLRHTFCYQLIQNGINLHTVSKLAGHKDINVTKRYVINSKQNDLAFSAIEKTFR
jgi:integrase/recombinase XerD